MIIGAFQCMRKDYTSLQSLARWVCPLSSEPSLDRSHAPYGLVKGMHRLVSSMCMLTVGNGGKPSTP
jgi:hypothetical protein